MKERFSYPELLTIKNSISTIQDGDTIHIHHCKEGRGNDRLYISNKEGTYLFYCHHCGKSGSLRDKLNRVNNRISKKDLRTIHVNHHIPSDVESDPSKWSIEARLWPLKASISNDMIKEVGMVWCARTNRVYVPISFGGEYIGFVSRRIDPDDGTPKYITKCDKTKKDRFLFVKHVDNTSKDVVLVEDILSCLRLNQLGYNAVALLGVNVDDSLFRYLREHYSRFHVWLDNDNTQVKLAQVKIKNKLELIGPSRIIKTEKDPKEYTDDEIREFVDEKESRLHLP